MLVKTNQMQTRNLRQTVMPTMVALTVSALTACGTALPKIPQEFERDPLTIVRVLNEAMNAHQFDIALDFFDDEVIFTDAAGKTANGKASVRVWMQSRSHQHSDLCDVWLSGNTITWMTRAHEDGTVRHDKIEAVLRDGKIKSMRWFELGD